MGEPIVGWWVVCVGSWGSVAILGTEAQAEDFRAHKSNWEQSVAWKLRVRDATPGEREAVVSFCYADSGVVRDDTRLPKDVSALVRLGPRDFMPLALEARDLLVAQAAPLRWPALALTLIQPWGTLVMSSAPERKDVENRTWDPGGRLKPGDRLWIHAGKKLDEGAHMLASSIFSTNMERELREAPRGVLLGHVRFDGITWREGYSQWFFGPCGWRLSDPVALREPIPCKGAQGLWRVPAPVLEIAREQMGRAA